MPLEVIRAMQVDKLAKEYGALPSVIEREGTRLIRHVNTVALGRKKAE